MDREKRGRLRAILAGATEWRPDECDLRVDPDDGSVYAPQGACVAGTFITLGDTYEGSADDWQLVAEARTAMPELLDALDAAEARIAELTSRLEARPASRPSAR